MDFDGVEEVVDGGELVHGLGVVLEHNKNNMKQ